PSTSCESYRGAKNPADLVSGIRACLEALIALDDSILPKEKKEYYRAYLQRMPGLFFEKIKGDKVVKPAESWLKYQNVGISPAGLESGEWMTVKLRYKEPQGEESILITRTVEGTPEPLEASSENFRFAAAVAEFGLLLRGSEYKGDASYPQVLELARGAKGTDAEGYRSEFIRLAETAEILSRNDARDSGGKKPESPAD
ncbi:MAG TPA: DUF3520 domain-containing protein, partial [bacterium]|nr:DUF3520 domain-containing protein [bacterium]